MAEPRRRRPRTVPDDSVSLKLNENPSAAPINYTGYAPSFRHFRFNLCPSRVAKTFFRRVLVPGKIGGERGSNRPRVGRTVKSHRLVEGAQESRGFYYRNELYNISHRPPRATRITVTRPYEQKTKVSKRVCFSHFSQLGHVATDMEVHFWTTQTRVGVNRSGDGVFTYLPVRVHGGRVEYITVDTRFSFVF